MSEPIRDPEALARHRADEEKPTVDADDATNANAQDARPCPVPVRPGYGQAAYKAGCEDEWIDRMSARYGGDW
jgi:hypothetical protein